MDDTTLLIVIIIVAVVAIAIVAMLAVRAKQRKDLQSRFGPEYERTIDSADSKRKAERDLRERADRRDSLDLRELSPAQRDRYRDEWNDLQARFVDRPDTSLADADRLVSNVMRDRGYPVDDFEEQAGLVSVDHPRIVEHYRAAHDIYERNRVEETDTEEQRKAVVHYRELFDELMRPSDGGGGDRHTDDDRQRDARSRTR